MKLKSEENASCLLVSVVHHYGGSGSTEVEVVILQNFPQILSFYIQVCPRSFTLFMLSETVRSMDGRCEVISQWYKLGGVLLLGYEMYRLLSLSVPSIGGMIVWVELVFN